MARQEAVVLLMRCAEALVDVNYAQKRLKAALDQLVDERGGQFVQLTENVSVRVSSSQIEIYFEWT